MNIIMNGQPLTLETAQTIELLLADQGYNGKLVAVAVNGEFLPKTAYNATNIHNGDQIEIVAPMQGG